MMFHKLKELITYAPFPLSDAITMHLEKKHYEIPLLKMNPFLW